MQLNPYLFFDGRCQEAFEVYERVLGGKIVMMLTHGETPAAEHVPAEWKSKIIHARLMLGDRALMGSDAPPGHFEPPKGFSAQVGVDDPAEAERIFHALAENGKVTMPIAETFWAVRFGMLVDRFGIPWMINCENAQTAAAAEGKSQTKPATGKEFVISRTFNAPRETVFAAFTDPKRMKQGGDRGGHRRHLQDGPADGRHLPLQPARPRRQNHVGQVRLPRDCAAGAKLRACQLFSDAKGGTTRHPMAPTWPREMLSTFLFTEKNGRTTFTVQWSPLAPTAEERATFEGGHESMMQGWTGTLDQLESLSGQARSGQARPSLGLTSRRPILALDGRTHAQDP